MRCSRYLVVEHVDFIFSRGHAQFFLKFLHDQSPDTDLDVEPAGPNFQERALWIVRLHHRRAVLGDE